MIYIILIYLLRFCCGQSPELNFVVNMDSQLECCDDISKEFVDTSLVIVGRYNDSIAYMHGDIVFKKDIGPTTSVEIILEKEASGKFETVFTHEINDLCAEVAKGTDSDYYPYIKSIKIPETCPFSAGHYPITELIVNTEDMPVNSNTAGRYQAAVVLYNNRDGDKTKREFMFCLTLKLLIELD